MTQDPFPCQELDCGYLVVRPLTECERNKCPWVYSRRREEDVEREAKDRKARGGDGVTDPVTIQTVQDADPCAATGCAMQGDPVETCRDHRCPHRWQREARLDRKAREEKDKYNPDRFIESVHRCSCAPGVSVCQSSDCPGMALSASGCAMRGCHWAKERMRYHA